MSVADTLHDAVADLDSYLTDGIGEAWSGQPYHGELLDIRDRMETLRCKIDAQSMGWRDPSGIVSYRERPK